MSRKRKAGSPMPAGQEPAVYVRSRWKHALRLVFIVILVVLNLSLIASTVQMHLAGRAMAPATELLSYIVVLLMDATILLPNLLEADKVEVQADRLVVKVPFWRAEIPWQEIRAFNTPIYLAFGIIATRRCF